MFETCFGDRGIDRLCMKHVSEIGVLIGCVETCFRDRGIDRLCMRCVSEIGVLIWAFFSLVSFVLPLSHLCPDDIVAFLYKLIHPGLISLSPFLPLSSHLLPDTMSSPSSSYVQVGLDNLECPLNRSPSPHAQVRGFDWSSVLVD